MFFLIPSQLAPETGESPAVLLNEAVHAIRQTLQGAAVSLFNRVTGRGKPIRFTQADNYAMRRMPF